MGVWGVVCPVLRAGESLCKCGMEGCKDVVKEVGAEGAVREGMSVSAEVVEKTEAARRVFEHG